MGGDQTIVYLDCGGGGYMTTCTGQNSQKCMLKGGWILLYENDTAMKPWALKKETGRAEWFQDNNQDELLQPC